MQSDLELAISDAVRKATGQAFDIIDNQSTAGGCINEARTHSDGRRRYFVKVNQRPLEPMFTAEAEALQALAATDTLRVPQVIATGSTAENAFLILEALDLGPRRSGDWEQMGRALAQLHMQTQATFGWHRSNFIGSTVQSNQSHTNWNCFFREERLRPQFQLARQNGYRFPKAEALLDRVEVLLANHCPEAALLHGDLWSGNAGFTRVGEPVVYDPASYFGDRETDLAFTEFFGGFPPAFYAAYQEALPLPPGYEARKPLYNLYHVLNHVNLFGSCYSHQADTIIEQLLSR